MDSLTASRLTIGRLKIPFISKILKRGGKIYQQTFVDTYSKVATGKLYARKTALAAAALLNGRVLPLDQEHGLTLLRFVTDRRTEYDGKPDPTSASCI